MAIHIKTFRCAGCCNLFVVNVDDQNINHWECVHCNKVYAVVFLNGELVLDDRAGNVIGQSNPKASYRKET